MGTGADEVIASTTVHGLLPSTSSDVESSAVYARMNDENKKKMQLRLRKLLEAVSEKEAIESNAALLSSPATTQETDAKIADISFKINRLLGVYSSKPFIEMQSMYNGVEAFVASGANTEALEMPTIMALLLKEITGKYDLIG
jgi:hypothetical protein